MIAVHLEDHTGIPAGELERGKQAIVRQVNTDLRRYWNVGKLRFRRNGWQIIVTRSVPAGGFHSCFTNGQPYAIIGRSKAWSFTLSHELLQMLVGRCGDGPEICDPVNGTPYWIGRTAVSNFVTPAWFVKRSKGPYDRLGLLRRDHQLAPGGFAR